ncbi:MAG: hypothetical protein H7315_01235 [Herminiimonas sp.]|nr:hypothetical protein [Herminiimonas sp.]
MSADTVVFSNSRPAAPRIRRILANLPCRADCEALSYCISQIWKQLLDALSDPITVTPDESGRTVSFMGAVCFRIDQDTGTVDVTELANENGIAGFHPVSNVGIDLPARLNGAWLWAFLTPFEDAIRDSFSESDHEKFGKQIQAIVRYELVRCLEQCTHWRRLRHALRNALCLDRDLLSAIRVGRHRLTRFAVTERQYNKALANRAHYRQLQAENPNLLWLYSFTDELGIAIPAGDIVASLKSKLLAQSGLSAATWRYLSRCNHRHFRHVIDFVGADGGTGTRWTELVHWLRWTTVLGCRVPIAPAIIRMFEHDAFMGKQGSRTILFRTVDLQLGTMRLILKEAEARHATGTLDAFVDGDLTDVVTWLQGTEPTLDPNQIRRGWKYLAGQADAWKAGLACRPVLEAFAWDSLVPRRVHRPWTVVPVADAWALRQEALAMRHCADSYIPNCIAGSRRVFSVRNENDKRIATVGIALESGRWRTRDVRGFANCAVGALLRAVADDTAACYDALYRMVGAPIAMNIDADVGDWHPVHPAVGNPVFDAQAEADDETGEGGDEDNADDTAWGMEESACPICDTPHEDQPCQHAALLYDRTFSEVCGGALDGAFDKAVNIVEREVQHACEFGIWRTEVNNEVADLPAQIGLWADDESFDAAFTDLSCEHRRVVREMILERLTYCCPLVTRTSWFFDQGGPGTSAAYYSYWTREPATVALWLQEEFNRRIDPVPVKPVAADGKFQSAQASVATADLVSEVTVHYQDRFHMTSDWIDQITISRTKRKRFTVRARKYVEDFDGKPRRRWLTLAKHADLRTSRELYESLVQAAQLLNVELDLQRVVSGIAKLDWLMAAVFARDNDLTLPDPPPPRLQTDALVHRLLGGRRLPRLTVSVEWGYDSHELPVRMDAWIGILSGRRYFATCPYWYEGERYTGEWQFDIYAEDALIVGYDGCGTGYQGSLSRARINGPDWCGHDIAQLLAEAYLDQDCSPTARVVQINVNLFDRSA